MSRAIYAQDDFDRMRPLKADWKAEERLADTLAKRHKVCAEWNEHDEIEFFDPEYGMAVGFVDPLNTIIK